MDIGALFSEYGDDVFNLLVHMTRDRYAAEDLTQDTFIKAFRHDANVMNSALNRDLGKIVDIMGATRATKLHQMLTRETIIMDKVTFSDNGIERPALGPDPQAEQAIQSDFKQLLQMVPTQVKSIQAHLLSSASLQYPQVGDIISHSKIHGPRIHNPGGGDVPVCRERSVEKCDLCGMVGWEFNPITADIYKGHTECEVLHAS
ncbi:RNA polymerase sigma factor [Alicyclobacillus sp. ALC3]|uniref:RNA polymerase sigma factor n=1 Tax=Alicyclobacillus sp. ALC3 TaxID=2796143 RepID=UPI00237A0558|nr:sigma factor [Alicyclobacillus sp. ALC3]WDL95274.1 hypothetical protein JC200_12690 [Alicyclobacillus sp. ALC3]